MERKLTEHMMVHHYTATASEASARSLQEVPLLKGSFGHHSSSLGHGVAASSRQESLYGSQHHQQGAGGPPIMASDSLYSLRGHHTSQRSSAIVTAEIVPVVPGHQRLPIEVMGPEEGPVGAMGGLMSSSVSSGAITSSSFMPATSMAASATLPRNLENGFPGGQQPQTNSHHAVAAASMRLHSVNSRLTSSPILVDTHVRTATNSLAMTTMPRTGSNGLMHHQSNGNGGGQLVNGPPSTANWPTASPPSSTSSASASTLPVKKKSVTIGTFTTVVEPFEEENMITSAV